MNIMTNIAKLDHNFRKIKEFKKDIDILVSETIHIAKSGDAMERAKAAVILKELGFWDVAAHVLEESIEKYPEFYLLKYELILVYALLKKKSESINLIIECLNNFPLEEKFIYQAIYWLLFFENRDCEKFRELSACLFLNYTKKRDNKSLNYYIAYALNNYGRFSNLEDDLDKVKKLNAKELHKTIEDAILNNSSFCFLRLGDGEGAILQGLIRSIPDEFKELNRTKFLNRWFGSSGEEVQRKIETISIELQSRLSEADVIGCPQWNWISSLKKKNQIQPLFNAIEAAVPALNSERYLTDVGICLFMENERLLIDLIRKAGSFSIITSRAELPGKLEEVTGSKINNVFLIPPPASDPDSRDGELKKGSHLFDCFDDMRKKLNAMSRNGLYLISAGFLGKIYALDIKKQGGIAIDIGHVADRWIGYESRPESKGPDLRLCNIKIEN